MQRWKRIMRSAPALLALIVAGLSTNAAFAGDDFGPTPFFTSDGSPDRVLETLIGVEFNEEGVLLTVPSNGCTDEDSFEVEVSGFTGHSPFFMSVYRVALDPCDEYLPWGVKLQYSYAELGLKRGDFVKLINPIGSPALMAADDDSERAASRGFIVIALAASSGGKHLGCRVIPEGTIYPAIYKRVHGPAPLLNCVLYMAKHCEFPQASSSEGVSTLDHQKSYKVKALTTSTEDGPPYEDCDVVPADHVIDNAHSFVFGPAPLWLCVMYKALTCP